MIYARQTRVISLRELRALNVRQIEADWDLFDTEGIPQRDITNAHMLRLRKVAKSNFERAAQLPVFPTPILLRVFKKPVKAVLHLETLREFAFKDVTHSEAIEGQHRTFAVLGLSEEYDDLQIEVTMISCDDADAERLFYEINGTARKMSPAAIDLSLAHQLKSGFELDKKQMIRGTSALLLRDFIEMGGHPYADKIEMPFKKPPVSKPWMRFHRTANSLRWLASEIVEENLRVVEEQRGYDLDMQLNEASYWLVKSWTDLERAMYEQVFGPRAQFGLVKGAGQWVHSHLFAIFTEGMLPLLRHQEKDRVTLVMLVIEPVVREFFKRMQSDKFVAAGFNGLGGSTGTLPYIDLVKELTEEALK